MKKFALTISALVVTGLVLTSCNSTNPGQESNINPGNLDLTNQYSASPTDLSQQTDQYQDSSSSTKVTPTSQKGSMKSLADFEKIPATKVTLVTTKGEVKFDLYRDQAPLTTANFLSLAKSGFYNGIVFHRVIADFMAQVGDPLTKDASQQAMWGTGGPGYAIPDEFGEGLKFDGEGIVAMANSGPNTGGSQFFITYTATPWLDGKHAIFGKVTQGMDVLRQIQVGDKIVSVNYQ